MSGSGQHENKIQCGDCEHRPQELAPQREHLAAQNLRHRQRGGKHQFQRAAAMIRAKSLTSLRRRPEFESGVQQDARDDVSPLVHPVVAPFESAPGPDTAAQAEESPDEHRLEPMPSAQPETGTDVQQPRAKSRSLRGVAVAPSLPTLAPAGGQSPSGLVLPGVPRGDTGQREKQPRQPMREYDRPPESVRIGAVRRVKRQRIRVSEARQQKSSVHSIGLPRIGQPAAQSRQSPVDEQNQ